MLTADARALVCVWDVISGDKLMEFSANQSSDYVELELTAMTFDVTYRRLVTALNDGSLAVWNFNNGNCLRQVYTTTTTLIQLQQSVCVCVYVCVRACPDNYSLRTVVNLKLVYTGWRALRCGAMRRLNAWHGTATQHSAYLV